MADVKKFLADKVLEVVQRLAPTFVGEPKIDRPKNPEHGDFSTNVALQLSKLLKRKPLELANEIRANLEGKLSFEGNLIAVKIEGPGFINFQTGFSKLQYVSQALAEG